MNISIWGSELCAWTNAAILAQQGHNIALTCTIPNQGFTEPGLNSLIQEQMQTGQLQVSTALDASQAEIHFFCFSPTEKTAALNAAKLINNEYSKPLTLINQANFGIGATQELQELLDECKSQIAAYVPDNTPEGTALNHLGNLSSLIIGCTDHSATQQIQALFQSLLIDTQKVVVMSPKEAEFSKFAVTGMLALRIGYINELANLADELQVNIDPIRHAMTLDSRISPEYLKPGCGFGGLHFSQYITGLAEILEEERSSTLLNSVLNQNEIQKETPFRKLWRYYKGDLKNKTISIWGLAFKPNTSSMDNAPSLRVIDALLAQGAKIRAHDPSAISVAKEHYPNHPSIEFVDNCYETTRGADGLLLLTEWQEYSFPNFIDIKQLMKTPLIIDGRNFFSRKQAIEAGFHYEGIGR